MSENTTFPEPNLSTYHEIKEWGRLFFNTYRELKARYGEDEAVDVMRSIARAQGVAIGESLAKHAPRDFEGFAEDFALAPDVSAIYRPHVRQLDDKGLDVQMMACPIKDAFMEGAADEAEVAKLLHCACPMDEATMETAGFDYEIELWSPGKQGCCRTRIWEKARP